MGRTGSTVPAVHTNLGPVTDWRSYFYDSGIARICTEDLYQVPDPPIYKDW